MTGSVQTPLRVTREQILAFRRRVGALDERMPPGSESLQRAAWAGLQDSMPRAALLSLHARVHGVEPSALDDPSLAQLWGLRYQTYAVAKRDFALFSLGRHPDSAKSRQRAERMAERLHAHLDGRTMTDREAADALGVGNGIRYAATTGTVAIRWEGARAPMVWTVPAAKIDPADARRELARRYLHIFGPATADGFARWAGISRRGAAGTFASLEAELLPVRTPLGEEWLLAEDETALRAAPTSAAPARLLPSGDTYFLLQGAERELLVPREDQRQLLWTSRVWPGALLVDGEIRGTWRRAQHTMRIDAWARLSRAARDAVEAEAMSLPLPGLDRPIEVIWTAPGAPLRSSLSASWRFRPPISPPSGQLKKLLRRRSSLPTRRPGWTSTPTMRSSSDPARRRSRGEARSSTPHRTSASPRWRSTRSRRSAQATSRRRSAVGHG